MGKFISKHIHWILAILLIINVISFSIQIDSTPDVVALIIGIIAFLSVLFLAIKLELKSRNKTKEGENE